MNSLLGMAIVKTFMLVLTVFQPIYWSFYNDFLTDEGNVSFVLAILDTKQDHCFLLLTLISTIFHIQTPMAFCSWPSSCTEPICLFLASLFQSRFWEVFFQSAYFRLLDWFIITSMQVVLTLAIFLLGLEGCEYIYLTNSKNVFNLHLPLRV